jgi:glycosyltransferase involved in cell wall biosynthesis
MKIALLGPGFPNRGGIVHFNSSLANALSKRSVLSVDSFYWSELYPRWLMPASHCKGKNRLTDPPGGTRILAYTNPLTWIRLIRRVRHSHHDLFVTHWVHPVHFPVFAFLFVFLRLVTTTKIILIVHNCLPHERFPGDTLLSRCILNLAHCVVVHGRNEAGLARNLGVKQDKIVAAFHPVYDQFTTPPQPLEDLRHSLGLRSKVLLFFGFIRPYKGLDILLDAFRSIAPEHPDLSLLIAGERFHSRDKTSGQDCGYWKETGPVQSQVVWIDRYVPDEEIGRYFALADVFVAPYRSVTQSGPLNIAYAFDRPAIASDLPGFRECVEVGESGYLFEPGNAADLARTIELFLEKPIPREKVRRYRQQFSWDRYVNLWL